MPKVTKEATIAASPDVVFAYLSDIGKHQEWAKHPIEIHRTSDGPIGVGSTWESDAKMMGHHHAKIAVTEYTPNQRFAFEAEDDTGRFRHIFAFSPDGSGTRLVRSAEMLSGNMVSKVLATVMMPTLGSRIAGEDMAKIKMKLEASPSAGAPAPV